MMTDNNYCTALADLLFPERAAGQGDLLTAAEYESKYPPRSLPEGAAVTRLGPSPTGFIHLGNLFMAIVNKRLAKQTKGVSFLRIEDTDQKREVEGAIPSLIKSLNYFGIDFDEGAGISTESGVYGPYRQSRRVEIYRSFAHKLVREGKAYPCFLTENQIESIRAEQEAFKQLPGIYGKYAEWRGADLAMIEKYILSDRPFVIRFLADYDKRDNHEDHDEHEGNDSDTSNEETITVTDGIRGDLTLTKNIMDVVILKTDGLPTYHFAHVIDDHLMRSTHVIRGEEWLPSLPIHIELFRALGLEPPVYCHTALLMKQENGIKRKLSKRKDPELSLSYYISEGYHPLAVEEYLLTIINSNYEEWRMANMGESNDAFIVTTEKMGASGIMFDLEKLKSISRETLSGIPAEELADFILSWTDKENPEVFAILFENKDVLTAALDVGRSGEKPRKDLEYASQILAFISYFFDELFRMEDPLPDNISEEEAGALLEGYLAVYDHTDDRVRWFEKIRELSEQNGYAAKPKDYKNNPDIYKGHVGDVSMVIRRSLTGRRNAPDIYEIQQILGEERTISRLKAAIL
jgi:glutamyl-tRNA synthetase